MLLLHFYYTSITFGEKDAWVWMEHSQEAFLPVQLKEQHGDKIIARSALGEVCLPILVASLCCVVCVVLCVCCVLCVVCD